VTALDGDTTIEVLSTEQAVALTAEFGRIYFDAFSEPPYSRSRLQADHFSRQVLPEHLAREDTVVALARDADGDPIGFCYGYQGRSGQYWTEYVRGILGSRLSREWSLGEHFEVAELAVEAEYRGHGVGRALILEVMAGAPEGSVVLLGTNEHADPALGLYRSLGFEEIRGNAGYVVLGRR